ncbi:MAG: argininosuccinate lyase [Rhodobacteraceae bacterium]|nr:argininosuccinate lyase [Paracoccaceae bacterium]
MIDTSNFPDPTYRDTVLAPLFEDAKTHFVAPVRAINQAHLVMLADTGILPREIGAAIAAALSDIDANTDIAQQDYTGEHEDYFFFVEHELIQRLGADVAGALHTARSRNDMDHTVFKLVLRSKADAFLKAASALADTLIATARRERDTVIVAYTHGQPAQPSTFGHYLAAVADVLLRDIARLSAARDALDACPMGSAAITTSGFPIDRQQVADLLGFAAPTRNSYGAIAGVDYITGLYSAIRLMMLHLGRVVQDLQFWTAFEVGQLYVPNSLVQISSIMPQKRNPVPIEHLRHLASTTMGRCETVITTMHNTPFTDMNDSEGAVQVSGYEAFASGHKVLALVNALIPACRINGDRVAAILDAACVTVTELADTLVRREDLSFRQAHEIAAATARAVIAERAPLGSGYAAFAAAFQDATGRSTTLGEDAFATAVSAENFVAIRTRPGGPAPAPMDAALDDMAADLAALGTAQSDRAARIKAAETTLTTAFAALQES